MKIKLFYLLLIPLFSISFQSCSEDEDSYAEWKQENEVFIDKIKNNPEYRQDSIPQGPGIIYYNDREGVEGGTGLYPIYTSKVKVRYKGSLIDGSVFDDSSERTVELSVNGVVSGFAVALQKMQVNEKRKIYIPWQLGYGSSGTSTGKIKPYSALIFEVELCEISEY